MALSRARSSDPAASLEAMRSAPIARGSPRAGDGRLAALWCDTQREVSADLRSWRWLRFLVLCWISGLVFLILMLGWVFGNIYEYGYSPPSACQPDGSFSIYRLDYNRWAISGFFRITLGFGTLTFTEAKVADVTWDIVVGRVGQAVLAICSWKAFSAYVRSSIDTTPVTYDTFWTVFMGDEASIPAMVRMIRDFATKRGLQSKAAMVFIVITMAFVLAAPTIAGAMSGYDQNTAAFVPDSDGNLYPFTQFFPVLYLIHDGWRVGMDGDYAVPWYQAYGSFYGGGDPLISRYRNEYIYVSYDCELQSGETERICRIQQATSDYVKEYGFLGLNSKGQVNDVESRWMNTTLSKPTLNITAFYLPDDDRISGWNWTDPRTKKTPFSDFSNRAYSGASNETYTIDYIQANGACQAAETYKWGFSFLQLFIVLVLLLVWTLGVWIMSTTAHARLARSSNGEEIPGKYKAAIILAQTMQKDLQELGDSPESLSGSEIQHYIDSQLDGGRMQLGSAFSKAPRSVLGMFREWVVKEKWWFIAVCLATVFVGIGWFAGFPAYWAGVCFAAGIYFAVMVGRARKSRLFFLAVSAILGLAVGLATGILWSS